MDVALVALVIVAGAAAFAIAALIWAMRVTDGARGSIEAWKRRLRDVEDRLSAADAVFGA